MLTKQDAQFKVESESLCDFARVMKADTALHTPSSWNGRAQPGRVNIEQSDVKNGLGKLVLTLVKLLHELLERQAIRRIDSGSLSDAEIDRLGITLMRQGQEIEKLRKEFNLEDEDLNIDLGPLGKLL